MAANVTQYAVDKTRAIFQWNIKDRQGNVHVWTADLKNGEGCIYAGNPKNGHADTTLTLTDEDFTSLVSGKLDAMKAFMTGRLKVSGNVMLAQKLQILLKATK